jgi:hypothetical protein
VLKLFDNVPSRSTRDLERVEVGRVAEEGLVDAAAMLQLSYRKVKRMWRRFQQVGRRGMKHAHAGRPSNLKSR